MKSRIPAFKTFLAILILISCRPESSRAQKLSAVQNYGVNRPGVVMVRTVFSADVYVNKMQLDSHHFNQLVDSIQKADSSGIIYTCLLYTSDAADEEDSVDLGG